MMTIEPERYELFEVRPTRRGFFKLLGGGIVVVSVFAQESGGGRRRGGRSLPQEIGAWLHIAEDGTITGYTGKVEVGQNARTSLTQAVAEELGVDPSRVRMVMADTQLTPWDAGTFGSQTTPVMFAQMRRVAAAAKQVLEDLARERGMSPPLNFGELAKGQTLMKKVIGTPKLKAASEWRVASKSLPKVNGGDIVRGRHQYTSDIQRPGMLYARVLRAPSFGAKLAAADFPKLEDVSFAREGDFIAAAAPTTDAAAKAIAAIKAEWKETPGVASRDLFEHLKKTGAAGNPQVTGSIEKGMVDGDTHHESRYTVAYIAHAPLEPRAAVAEWTDGKLTVWTGTQRPFGVQGELAQAFGIEETNVRVIVPDTGSGYGGKHTGECAIEAARMAKAAGKPVKLVWTREEEFSWAYARPSGVIEVKSAAAAAGSITAWEFHNYNSGGSAIRPLYDIPNQKIVFHPSQSPMRQGSYRGLAATANHFARESHIDELAALVGIDPLEFRLRNIKDARLRAVVEAAAEKFGWAKRRTMTGMSCGFEKGGYLATCVEISVFPNRPLRIDRVVQAFECGAVVNPEHLKNQIEGAIVQGIGGALFETLEVDNGRVVNGKFSKYRVPRFSDAPPIEVVLVDRKDLPSAGSGETPIVGIAPALANAYASATGKRIRSLPMFPAV